MPLKPQNLNCNQKNKWQIIIKIFLVALIFVASKLNAQKYRYVHTVFEHSVKTADIVYSTPPHLKLPYINESGTSDKDLLMDIYQPENDELTMRPAIVFAHGGGFLAGKRSVDDMQAFCDSFARKGYVTATIDYRLGVEVADNPDLHYIRAAYRGLQDGRAAIRYLRANAETYGIDPNNIYWGGNSAGSFIGLSIIYMDSNDLPVFVGDVEYSTLTSSWFGPDLGDMDIGDNLLFDGKPNAVMACWGGISDTLTIDKKNNTPVFLIHGTADNIVPFNSGAPFNLYSISPVYGSNSINSRLNNLDIPANYTYFVDNKGHGFYGVLNGRWINGFSGNDYWDTIVQKATQFYWEQHKPLAAFSYTNNDKNYHFTDLSLDANSWLWDFGDGTISTQRNPQHTYENERKYQVLLYVENTIHSWDTLKQEISIGGTTAEISMNLSNPIKIYPNPVEDFVYIDSPTLLQHVTIKLFTISGKLIIRKVYDNNFSQTVIPANEIDRGIYFIQVISDDYFFQQKILKN